MRSDGVLILVLHMAYDTKCFSPYVYLYFHRQLSDNFILSQKMPTFGLYEYEKRGVGLWVQLKMGPR